MMDDFPRTIDKLGLYPIVDSLEWMIRLLDLGVCTIQLRIKNRQDNEIENIVHDAIVLGKQYCARLFINDYWHLAIQYNAYGIHLGQQDLDLANLIEIQQAGLRLGISTHNKIELNRAIALRPSYISIGHIFPTITKNMPLKPQGIIGLKHHLVLLKNYNIPTVAIGGISLSCVPEILATGVGGIALVSAIIQSTDWRNTTLTLLKMIEKKDY
ncbi:thiamine phosphate synthase [Pantoea sp. Aalb]|uniref:thiamine phosphate synthase n=1 Tax=Pantoea sp. Aalb TaxID=2576762 RepID=UPI0013285A7E|nr:thiamine phosphate synthase [Pantoea sp. Aalb]MXP67970.1 thiamine phosphate synthase [Pantoea sp. Aalb]